MTVELYPYQKHDAGKIAASPAILLASDTGTGKTATLVKATEDLLEEVGGPLFVVVACPAVARGVWAQEWKRWASPRWAITRINSGSDVEKIKSLDMNYNNVVIVSYDQFSRMEGPKKARLSPVVETLVALAPEVAVVIADEAHYLKGWGSNRTTAVYDLAKRLDARMWLASATPAPNHYGEVYPMVANLWPDELTRRGIKSKEEFEDHYCLVSSLFLNGREIRTIKGSKNGPDLKTLLSAHMIRRKKADVIADLPPMTFDTLPLDNPFVMGSNKKIEDGFAQFDGDELLSVVSANQTHLATLRKEVGMVKVSKCIEWIIDFLEPDPAKKIVVFAYHTDVIDALVDGLADFYPVKIDGRSKAGDRDTAVVDFQTGRSRVFVGQIVAAGTAITLTAASDVLFVESDWTPSNNYQAASRCHRIGQKGNVVVRHAVLENSLDERIAKALVRKEQELAEIFG